MIAVLIGLVAGLVVFWTLRHRGLRWTWALAGIPLTYCVFFIEWQLGFGCGVATGTTLYLGVTAHDEAVKHGGEEAKRTREMLGPARWIFSRVSAKRGKTNRLKNGQLAIGSCRRGGPCRVPFGLNQGVHGLITGATGSGKGVDLAAFLQAYVEAGFAGIVADPKGDENLRRTAQRSALETGSRFIEWTPSGPSIYNPLARGNPTEIADKALAAHSFSEPHYELATQRLLGHVLTTLRAAELWPPTLSNLVAYMEPERLDALASKVGGEPQERVNAYVDGLSERGKADLGGGRDRLAVLADGELGPWLDPERGGGELIDLAGPFAAVTSSTSTSTPIATSGLKAPRLSPADRSRRPHRRPAGSGFGGLLVIDEFAALAAEQVSRLFGRARSAGLSLLLATQSLADLRQARPNDPSDTLTEQVLSNIAFAIAHRAGDPDTAERLARMAGTVPSWSMTERDQRQRLNRRHGGRDPHPRARVPDRPRSVQAPRDGRSGGDQPDRQASGADRADLAGEGLMERPS